MYKRQDRGSPKHQEEQNGGKRGKTRADNRAHDRAARDHAAPAASNMARPGRAGWHDCATWHGRARCAAAGFVRFAIFGCGFPSLLGTARSTFLRAYFRVELGLSLGLNKPIRGRLD